MQELLRTTDVVLISHVTAILKDYGISILQLDEHMSVLEGSIGFLIPKRLMVADEDLAVAVRALDSCDLAGKISPSARKQLQQV
jgi:hypothetical protein